MRFVCETFFFSADWISPCSIWLLQLQLPLYKCIRESNIKVLHVTAILLLNSLNFEYVCIQWLIKFITPKQKHTFGQTECCVCFASRENMNGNISMNRKWPPILAMTWPSQSPITIAIIMRTAFRKADFDLPFYIFGKRKKKKKWREFWKQRLPWVIYGNVFFSFHFLEQLELEMFWHRPDFESCYHINSLMIEYKAVKRSIIQ